MKRKAILCAAAALIMSVSGCSQPEVSAQIQIPILDNGGVVSYKTAAVERHDLFTNITVGGTVGYFFEDTLPIGYDTNVVSYNVKKNDVLKEGDIIAVFDSSELDYEYKNQKALADSAYSRYAASGGEAARLEYEIEAEKLALVQGKIDSYTVKAPYDCIVSSVERLTEGSAVTAGTPVCTVARTDEAFVAVKDNKESFAFGKHVDLKFGTETLYSGTVVMTPDSTIGKGNQLNGFVIIRFDEGEYERASKDIGNLVASGWATVIVESVHKTNALCIPSDAVIKYSGTTYCYIDKNGERIRLPIETGETANGITTVISGLAEGDTVSYV